VLEYLFELSETEHSFTDEEIIGEFMGIFLAGTDTTSHLLAYAAYYLWSRKDIYDKLKDEIK